MYRIDAYHRPATLHEAMDLLADSGRVALAGGTSVRHDGAAAPTEVVDLQDVGLDHVTADDSTVRIDAMVRLQDLVDDDSVPGLIRRAARAELPSTLRTLATVGGTIGAAGAHSLLLTALLVHDATVHFADDRRVELATVLTDGVGSDELIIAVEFAASGTTAVATTGRTPGDDPIVGAAARRTDDGIRLALCGVGSVPRLVEPVDLGSIEPVDLGSIEPPGDFRGSAAYRRHLAVVLSERVTKELA